jgi:hypothetical protein
MRGPSTGRLRQSSYRRRIITANAAIDTVGTPRATRPLAVPDSRRDRGP